MTMPINLHLAKNIINEIRANSGLYWMMEASLDTYLDDKISLWWVEYVISQLIG